MGSGHIAVGKGGRGGAHVGGGLHEHRPAKPVRVAQHAAMEEWLAEAGALAENAPLELGDHVHDEIAVELGLSSFDVRGHDLERVGA